MLAFLQFREDSRLLAFPLEPAERVLERFVFFDVNDGHPKSPPSSGDRTPTNRSNHSNARMNGRKGRLHSEYNLDRFRRLEMRKTAITLLLLTLAAFVTTQFSYPPA